MSKSDNKEEDFQLMDMLTENEIIARAIVANSNEWYNTGFGAGFKSGESHVKVERYFLLPLLWFTLGFFLGMSILVVWV